MEKYCKREGCEKSKKPCELWNECFLFDWDLDRLKEKSVSNDTEESEQKDLFAWCKSKKIEMIHIPNERKSSVQQLIKLTSQGMRKGFPDNFFPYPKGCYHGLFIELKRSKKSLSKVSTAQYEWIKKLTDLGLNYEKNNFVHSDIFNILCSVCRK